MHSWVRHRSSSFGRVNHANCLRGIVFYPFRGHIPISITLAHKIPYLSTRISRQLAICMCERALLRYICVYNPHSAPIRNARQILHKMCMCKWNARTANYRESSTLARHLCRVYASQNAYNSNAAWLLYMLRLPHCWWIPSVLVLRVFQLGCPNYTQDIQCFEHGLWCWSDSTRCVPIQCKLRCECKRATFVCVT